MLFPMATRRYARGTREDSLSTERRILDAAEELVREDRLHTSTMEEVAERAGVSRATLFARFGSKLGVLEALARRCDDSPQTRALGEALRLTDPRDALAALVEASCAVWERWGGIQRQLRAVVVLEPEVEPLISDQRAFQRRALEGLVGRLAADEQLRDGLSTGRAAATLHMLTSLEAFTELRRESGLSMRQATDTIRELAFSLLR